MNTLMQDLKTRQHRKIWSEYCGFLDLRMPEYMRMQRDLLLEQVKRLASSRLGRKLLGPNVPGSVEEFRASVPFTTYEDYADYLVDRNEEVLPEKPYVWVHTSGRSGEYPFKWVPYTKAMYDTGARHMMGAFILASCDVKGRIAVREGDTSLYSLAPPPYISGVFMRILAEEFNFRIFPPPGEAEAMGFQERIQAGFNSTIGEGLDFFFGISSILLRISEQFSGGTGERRGLPPEMKRPAVLLKLLKAFVRSKLEGRPLLPRDVWKVKGVLCSGADTSIFKDRVRDSWGRTPLEVYAATELGLIATQAWDFEGLTFFPASGFWEFIPVEDYHRMRTEKTYTPRALLLDQVDPGQEYVLAGTNFHGGIMVRYIVGDLVKIVSRGSERAGIELPQMVFSTRIDDVIDIGGFTRLTEKTVWKAIEMTGVPYSEWTIRKEYQDAEPILHLYVELKNDQLNTDEIAQRIHESLKALNEPYRDLEAIGGMKPLRVTALSKGTFRRYYEERQAAGADLAHLKPSHIEPPEAVMRDLLRMSSWKI